MDVKQKARLTQAVLHFREQPDSFITQILGDTLEDFQARLCRLFVEHDRLAVPACHSVGKTFTVARIALAFLYCYINSLVITTAPTHRQVVKLLWGEIRAAKKKSKVYLDGKLLNNELKISDEHYAMGFSPQLGAASDSREQQGSSFQGFHAKYVLIIFDEATGITRDMYVMAEGLLTSGIIVKWLCIGNPTSRASEFFKICQLAEWYVFKINFLDSPNLKANGFKTIADVKREIKKLRTLSDNDRRTRIKNYLKPNGHLITAQWSIAKLFQWGFTHPLSLSKILGDFPESDDNSAVKWENIQKAINRPFEDIKVKKRFIGVDPARYGDDLTVITELEDNQFEGKDVSAKEDTSQTAGRVIRRVIDGNINVDEIHITVDGTGLGAGVVDALNEAKRPDSSGVIVLPDNVFIHEVHNAQACTHTSEKEEKRLKATYENIKALMFDRLNEDLKEEIVLPDEEIYLEELPDILVKWSRKGRLVIESKEEYKARNGKSPDHADSLALANEARYRQPTYGTFKNTAKGEEGKPHSKRQKSKFPEVRKTTLRVKEY